MFTPPSTCSDHAVILATHFDLDEKFWGPSTKNAMFPNCPRRLQLPGPDVQEVQQVEASLDHLRGLLPKG